eukprot:9785_1
MATSNLFSNHADHEQFQCIIESIRHSPLIKSMHVSDLISKDIAEFATGKWELCGNSSCKGNISILQEDLETNTQNKSKMFKYCPKSQRYFCALCMNNAVHLKYCNTDPSKDCCCVNLLHFKPDCDICPCGNILPDMNTIEASECECNCCIDSFNPRDCANCNKPFCRSCWEKWSGLCKGCGKSICGNCTVFPHSNNGARDFPDVHSFFNKDKKQFRIQAFFLAKHKMCIGCYSNNTLTKKCDKCEIECKMYWDGSSGDPYLFCDENKKFPLMIKCNEPWCETYVCYGCGTNAATDRLDLKCSYCKQDVYPATLCATHAKDINKIECPQCFRY